MDCNKKIAGVLCVILLICFAHSTFASQSVYSSRNHISYDHDCFQINGEDIFIYSGSIHYCRTDKPLWRDRLMRIKQAGFNTVQFYIAWNYHEPLPGKSDFSQLEEFIELCDEMGLYITVRIGPYICAEWDHGGFPDWLITKGIRNYALRTNESDYVEFVKYWYRQIIPVIRKHLITNEGNILFVQIENEYGGGAYFKREAIKDLYKVARKLGIDVPIVTCNTPYAWDNEDPVMSDIINGNNSTIVRWSNITTLENRVSRARSEEHNAPTIILEMPGGQGMHSNFVGYEADPLDSKDFVAVHKSALMEGASLTNFYMLYGGTNLGYWGASYQSTSYCGKPPVQAPILEPGGLTESYYHLKLIGQWLELFGTEYARSRVMPGGAEVISQAESKPAKIIEKVKDHKAFIFLREEENKPQKIKFTYTDPSSGEKVTVPNKGYMALPARDTQILVANHRIDDYVIRYSTSQILGIGNVNGHKLVVMYGTENSDGQISLLCPEKPRVYGANEFQWDEKNKSVTINYIHKNKDIIITVDNIRLYILTQKRALTTWMVNVHGSFVPVISDSYLLRDCLNQPVSTDLNVDTLPGENKFIIPLPEKPKEVKVNDQKLAFEWDDKHKLIEFDLDIPPLPEVDIELQNAKFMADRISEGNNWVRTELRPLELDEIYHKGYIRYKASFLPGHAETMQVRFYEGSAKSDYSRQTVGDPALVLINGKCVPEASGWHSRKVEFDLAGYVKPNEQNTIEVVIEKIGRPCGAGGWGMAEPKGLASVVLKGSAPQPWITIVDDWKMHIGLHGQNEGYHKFGYNDSHWQKINLGTSKLKVKSPRRHDGIGWYRMDFDLNLSNDWDIPLKLNMNAKNDALIYINGFIAGRYNENGWQRDFYLPACRLNLKGKNTIAVVIRNQGNECGLYKASIQSYNNFSVKRNQLEIVFN